MRIIILKIIIVLIFSSLREGWFDLQRVVLGDAEVWLLSLLKYSKRRFVIRKLFILIF